MWIKTTEGSVVSPIKVAVKSFKGAETLMVETGVFATLSKDVFMWITSATKKRDSGYISGKDEEQIAKRVYGELIKAMEAGKTYFDAEEIDRAVREKAPYVCGVEKV